MDTATAHVRKNIDRARHSLPYLHPTVRELISLIPALFCEGRPVAGISGHCACTQDVYNLLKKHLGRRPEIIVGRLPDTVMLESLIVLLRPCLSNEFSCSIKLLCRARSERFTQEIREKAGQIREVFRTVGVPVTCLVHGDALPQLLVYDVMRTGIVLAGMHPVIRLGAPGESVNYIGELPHNITDPSRLEYAQWNPFQCFLDQEVTRFIEAADYPAPLSIPGANPFLIPYLHILHRYDEMMATDALEKIRTCLSHLFGPFPPTREAMNALLQAWRRKDSFLGVGEMSFTTALYLRKWLVPLEAGELPIFSWPPPGHVALAEAHLCRSGDLWHLGEMGEYRHPYPWVVLLWGVMTGLINQVTRLVFPSTPRFRRDAKQRLLAAYQGLLQGVDIIVPEDHQQGSVRRTNGRYFFSDKPFAILETGTKHSLELFESIKKKALLDDIDLEKYERKPGKGT